MLQISQHRKVHIIIKYENKDKKKNTDYFYITTNTTDKTDSYMK